MPIIRQIQQFIQQDNYTFSFHLKDVYLYIPIVMHYHYILPCQWKGLLLGWVTAFSI